MVGLSRKFKVLIVITSSLFAEKSRYPSIYRTPFRRVLTLDKSSWILVVHNDAGSIKAIGFSHIQSEKQDAENGHDIRATMVLVRLKVYSTLAARATAAVERVASKAERAGIVKLNQCKSWMHRGLGWVDEFYWFISR
jgi:hypothetical protein